MQQRVITILLSKYVIALILTFVAILFIPNYFNKYTLKKVKESIDDPTKGSYYYDIDQDGWSEKILSFYNSPADPFPAINIFTKDGILIDQWNFRGTFLTDRKQIFSTDANHNNHLELFLFTQVEDSIFLNILEPVGKEAFQKNDIFIDTIDEYNNSISASVFANYSNGHNTSFTLPNNEIIFSINTGFLGDVRHVYKYDLDAKHILKSPHTTNSATINEVIDLDNDGKYEYILNVAAFGNTIGKEYTSKSDYSSWFTVLDDDLSFYFDPIEFTQKFSSIQAYSYKEKNEINFLILHITKNYIKNPIQLQVYSNNGKLLKSKDLKIKSNVVRLIKMSNEEFVIYDQTNKELLFFNSGLELIKTKKVDTADQFSVFDLDLDGSKEFIQYSRAEETAKIRSYDLFSELDITLEDGCSFAYYGILLRGNSIPLFYMNCGYKTQFFEYSENLFYYLKYIVYLGIYLSILLILSLVIKGYQINEKKKTQIKEQISKLQLQTIKNKVDPHFVFNAMNTISEMTLMDNKLEADKFISQFSRFMRKTLNHSDKIVTSLQEELEYTENFIKLQQIRFNYNFDYAIEVARTINKSVNVPKHVLFTYVENAIKHGLSSKKNGLLKIEVLKNSNNNLVLAIEDNGGGIRQTQNKEYSTGNGLKIMDEIFELFGKLKEKKIQYTMLHLNNENDAPKGIRIEITIKNKNDS